jgi:hypothetical protein
VHRFKVRLGCDVGEGVGRSQSVIVVRDDLGVLEIFANQFESKAETAHKICGLAQKWQIGDWMVPPTLRYQGNVDGPFRPPMTCRKFGIVPNRPSTDLTLCAAKRRGKSGVGPSFRERMMN